MLMPFEKAEYLERLKKVKKSMADKGIDVLLITDPANMCYVTGHNAWSFYVHQMVLIDMDDECLISLVVIWMHSAAL